jgi:hypothetical protein
MTRDDRTEAAMEGLTLTDALRDLEARGYRGSFLHLDDGALRCEACGAQRPAEAYAAERQHRIEGASDPADESLVVGIVCPACGTKGSVLFPYGARVPRRDAAILSHIERATEAP